ncbi:MAG: MoaD/ThiS family protein [Anaerolineae bacterium]|nr:MoaD/ThiS family protein [Anaerolineae bacterium]
MKITVKLFATLRPYLGEGASGTPVSVEIPPGATIGQLAELLKLPPGEVKICFVNGKICDLNHVLADGDEVGIFPPIGGG